MWVIKINDKWRNINYVFLNTVFHQADDFICSPDQKVAVTEAVTFQIKFESKVCINVIE